MNCLMKRVITQTHYSPEIPEKVMASESRTSNDEVTVVTVNPVAVLVALTRIVCCPPATPVYWKPDMPTRATTFGHVMKNV